VTKEIEVAVNHVQIETHEVHVPVTQI
jgi:hypothetical protein